MHRSIPSSSATDDCIFVAWAVSILIAKNPDSLMEEKQGVIEMLMKSVSNLT